MPDLMRDPQPVGEFDLMAIGPIVLIVLAILGLRKFWRTGS